MAAGHLREARACEETAERAEAEAREYRRKAKMLIENALMEVEMFEGEDCLYAADEDDVD
jgi:hypothetical protein